MKKIVACVDGAGYTQAVCDYAAWAALRLEIPLEFLHVPIKHPEERLDASGSIGLGAQESLLAELSALDERRSTLAREHGRQVLEGARQRATAMGIESVDTRQRLGELVENLKEAEEDTRLFVLGQHDEVANPKRFFLDHHLEAAIRALRRPVLVATADFKQPTRFMIAFDGSATGRKMVDTVADSPLLRGLQCNIATVGDNEQALNEAADRLQRAGFDVTVQPLAGEPVEALIGYAQQAEIDMLVMGAYGHSRIRHLVVGSTTTELLRRATTPVFVLR